MIDQVERAAASIAAAFNLPIHEFTEYRIWNGTKVIKDSYRPWVLEAAVQLCDESDGVDNQAMRSCAKRYGRADR